jgi:16S rRNA G966 N2-methylase RsmD
MLYQLPNDSVVAVHDIFDPLPAFMHQADTVFVDPPYNQSLLTNYLSRDTVTRSAKNTGEMDDLIVRIIKCIQEISPRFCFLETGKERLPDYLVELKRLYRYVTFYNSSYFHKQSNKCYIIHATNDSKRRRYKELEDQDEESIVKWICAHHSYQCIGDLCMGKGLVGIHAYKNGKKFVGTEINKKRLSALVNHFRWAPVYENRA